MVLDQYAEPMGISGMATLIHNMDDESSPFKDIHSEQDIKKMVRTVYAVIKGIDSVTSMTVYAVKAYKAADVKFNAAFKQAIKVSSTLGIVIESDDFDTLVDPGRIDE